MLRSLRENLILKIVSLLASLSLWLYVTADRDPGASYTRSVTAEPVRSGAPPADVVVRIRPEPLTVEVKGPRSEVEAIDENEIKAEVDMRGARPGVTQLKIVRYRKPPEARSVEISGRQYISVDVTSKARKLMPVAPMFNTPAGTSARYGTPRIKPEWASVVGAADDVKRVARLVVSVETSGQPVNADLPIRAEDRDGVEITSVEVAPQAAHVEVAVEQPPATRNLVVNVIYRGKPATGQLLSEVSVEPATVTVVGKPEHVQALSNIPTQQVDIEGISGEVVRQVSLSPPDGVALTGGRPTVRVTFRTSPVAVTAPTGTP